VGNPALIGLDLPLTGLISIARKRRKILTCTQKIQQEQSLSDSRLIRPKATKIDMKMLQK
jgi:hypothetical protein